MRLNSISPADGSKRDRKRVGRGGGSGLGKTAGRGHKGQKSRNGKGAMIGFEGGQMPLQRRLPKFGFTSRTARYNAELRLDALQGFDSDVVDLTALKAANLIRQTVTQVKVILAGELNKAVTLRGIAVTRGARAAIEKAGGKIED